MQQPPARGLMRQTFHACPAVRCRIVAASPVRFAWHQIRQLRTLSLVPDPAASTAPRPRLIAPRRTPTALAPSSPLATGSPESALAGRSTEGMASSPISKGHSSLCSLLHSPASAATHAAASLARAAPAAPGAEEPRPRQGKVVWVASENAAVLCAARALGWPIAVFREEEEEEEDEEEEAGGEEGKDRGSVDGQPDYLIAGGFVLQKQPSEGHEQGQEETGGYSDVGVHVRVEKGEDQSRLRQLAEALGPSADSRDEDHASRGGAGGEREPFVVLETLNWKIITAENAVAFFQRSSACVLGVVGSTEDAALLLQALEVGLDGVVLQTNSMVELQLLQAMLARGLSSGVPTRGTGAHLGATSISVTPGVTAAGPAAAGAEVAVGSKQGPGGLRLELLWARVTRVQASAAGHRVCVDLCSLLPPNSGLLVGSFARGLFLVHSECLPTDFVPSRPFRVNAGPVCSYVALPGGRTAYLSELQAGSEVLVVDAETGAATAAVVGRAKVEIRPMLQVEAEVELEGSAEPLSLTIFLQNAETVRLIVPETSSPSSSSPQERELPSPGAGKGERGRTGGCPSHGPVGSKSVAELQLGDRVLVQVMGEEGVARHTGIAVREYILEK